MLDFRVQHPTPKHRPLPFCTRTHIATVSLSVTSGPIVPDHTDRPQTLTDPHAQQAKHTYVGRSYVVLTYDTVLMRTSEDGPSLNTAITSSLASHLD